ncbi:MAG: iron-sulfur cluster assembly scaffold protein [Clostridiales bacterium]|nr:iron-sulfur cluster assembly scaffold protein [Clostridiales bacterium]
MKFPYNEKVLEHFLHPHNVGRIEDPDGKAMEGSAACGDMVAVYIKVDSDSKIITDIRFESYGCASNIATASIITDLALNKSLDDAKKITWQEASEALGGLPSIKVHCSVLAVEGLHAAIQDYEERNGLLKNVEKTTVEIIKKRLKRVMNPVSGLDIVRTNLVNEITIENHNILIKVNSAENEQFSTAIKEDIIEKLENLWDVDSVTVEFLVY